MSNDLIGNYKDRIKGSGEVSLDGQNWNGTEIETESVAIHDPGTGGEVILRHFFFSAKPREQGSPKPTKQQLFSEAKQMIEMALWGDGLVPMEERHVEVHTRGYLKKISPALYTEMLKHRADYVIMVPARPRKGVLVNERPRIAQ